MTTWVLFFHLLAAAAWIGGSLLLFALGLLLRNKEAQTDVYKHLGPLYGYLESAWLLILWVTGLLLFFHYHLDTTIAATPGSALAMLITKKLIAVALLTLFTLLHMVIAWRTHQKRRTPLQHLLSRGSSLAIFGLNFFILWYAIALRNLL